MNKIKELNEYTDEEKIKWFNGVYNDVREQVMYMEEHGHEPKDCAHHTWEAVIELLGADIWVRWNAACIEER